MDYISSNILSITISYIKLHDLPSFFFEHNIPLHTKFTYHDKQKSTIQTLQSTIQYFPFLALIGAHITLCTPNINIPDFNPLNSHSKLTHLNISNNIQIFNLNFLNSHSKLIHLNISNCINIINLNFINSHSKLTYLNISHTQIINLTPITSLLNLRYLDISYTSITDLTPLKSCDTLKTLKMMHNKEITNLTPLATCSSLIHLNIENCINIKAYPLNFLSSLRTLNISRCNVPELCYSSPANPKFSSLRTLNLYASCCASGAGGESPLKLPQ